MISEALYETTAIECVKLTSDRAGQLAAFLRDLETHSDTRFFAPHPTSEEYIRGLCDRQNRDICYLLVSGHKVAGYGLLRGWDEGFAIPSLGIAIHPTARGLGLGELLMHFLH